MNDKVQHAFAGFFAGLFGAMLYCFIALVLLAFEYVLPLKGIIPVPFIVALAVGITKEVADWLDNRMFASDLRHEVDPLDVLAAVVPGLATSLVFAAIAATR